MSAFETFIAYKFVELLSTPWEEQDAYKLGIIDDKGEPQKRIRDLATQKERDSYTVLHRLVFGIKRLTSRIPFIRTKLGTYAAALALIKEHYEGQVGDTQIFEREFLDYARKTGVYVPLEEALGSRSSVIPKGKYALKNDILDSDGDIVKAGTKINISKDIKFTQRVLGKEVFELKLKNGKKIAFSADDIRESR